MNRISGPQTDNLNASSAESGLLAASTNPTRQQLASGGGSDVVFSDYVAYSPLIIWLLLVAPITTLSCALLVCLEDDQPPAERALAIKILLAATGGILLLYLFLLPIRVNVMKNGDVSIRVVPLRYRFSNVVRAYQSPGIFYPFYVGRLKFVTHQDKRVIVVRRQGKWDVCVSPRHPKDFVNALSNVLAMLESEGGGVL